MADIFHVGTPSSTLLRDIMAKVNALGSEPTVLVEIDKMAYVPGLKSKWEVSEWVKSTSIQYISASKSKHLEEPDDGQARYEFIVCAANHAAKKWGLDEYAVAFLLAIAKHETGLGTLGKGVKSKGSYVLGYGCPGDCDPAYQGINKQMYYGAKRYKEAMKSRINAIRQRGGFTRDDVDYFHEGGDKGYGKWVWSADGPNWKNRVYQYVQEFLNQDLSCKLRDFNFDLDNNDNGDNKPGIDILPTFPIRGAYFGDDSGEAFVTSHSSKNPNATRSNHRGIDIVLRTFTNGYGAEIVAAWDGVVIESGVMNGYGEVVMIRHANGWETVYAHLIKGSRRVSKGQKVKQGQVIGQMGNTGNVRPAPTPDNPFAGTHLHFEIWKGGWNKGTYIDPYPVLTGQQRIPAGSATSNEDEVEMEITENIKFDKCFDKDGTLSKNWIHLDKVTWFSVPAIGRKVVGYKAGAVPAGDSKSFSFKHNFSADGYFEYSLYLDLKQGDRLTVSVDGIPVEIFTDKDSGNKIIYKEPVYIRYDESLPSRVIDFHLESSSGKAVVGLVCFKVSEIEVLHGTSQVGEEFHFRTEDRWYEIGDFVYEDTFYIDDDIVEWEVNTHYDMQSATARITLDNSSGIYSPNYHKSSDFPENKADSIYSYYENGKLQHVISEGAPVRIYAGYGNNLVRVFTGRVKGEIEEDSEQKTVTFTCVDMYDVLEEHVFHKVMAFPDPNDQLGHHDEEGVVWVKSEIVKAIIRDAGLVGWRYNAEDLKYPDYIIEDTYYIDIDRGAKKAVVLDENGNPKLVELKPEKWAEGGYKNPYVTQVQWQIGTKASDAINELISDINYRAYCNRYGTFILEPIEYGNNTVKWEFVDSENLIGLSTSVDYSRVRNHLMITGSAGLAGKVEHFFDRDLLIATKGNIRTMGIQLDWIDESFGANARGQKEAVAKKTFFDMKRMARTYNVIVKGNPLIEVMDGCYIYDQATSTQGYYIIKGNRLVGNREGMLNFLELTWENVDEPIVIS